MTSSQRPLVIGLGSPHGDDQAGWGVVDRIRQRGIADARRAGDGVALLTALDTTHDVVVVDAAAPAGHPGRVRVISWPSVELREARLVSTHGMGLVEALRMAEAVGRLPRRVTGVAIEAEGLAPGTPLGPAVDDAVERVVEHLVSGASLETIIQSDQEARSLLGEPA